jgi:hypothetical protein
MTYRSDIKNKHISKKYPNNLKKILKITRDLLKLFKQRALGILKKIKKLALQGISREKIMIAL